MPAILAGAWRSHPGSRRISTTSVICASRGVASWPGSRRHAYDGQPGAATDHIPSHTSDLTDIWQNPGRFR